MGDRIIKNRDLSVIIPTYNESENLPIILSKLKSVLREIKYEIIIIDDNSPDETWKIAQEISKKDNRVRCFRRQHDKGLSSAVNLGMKVSEGKVISVMDADLQHDESILPKMYHAIAEGECDICVGSREVPGGSYGEWSLSRRFVSLIAKLIQKLLLKLPVKDPMSGYFAVSREYFDRTNDKINTSGFKILLEYISRGENPRVKEIGYVFRTRKFGETKLNSTVAVEYILALIDLRFGWLIPNKFVKFGMVGISGSIVSITCFAILSYLEVSILVSIFTGVQAAILWTYFGNNIFTFSPIRYRGVSYFKGLILYEIASVFGLVIQLTVVISIINVWPIVNNYLWSKYLAYMVGVSFAAVGNYLVHTNYTWNKLGFKLSKPARVSVAPISNSKKLRSSIK